MDVVYALKRQGRTLYGFGGWASSCLALCRLALWVWRLLVEVVRVSDGVEAFVVTWIWCGVCGLSGCFVQSCLFCDVEWNSKHMNGIDRSWSSLNLAFRLLWLCSSRFMFTCSLAPLNCLRMRSIVPCIARCWISQLVNVPCNSELAPIFFHSQFRIQDEILVISESGHPAFCGSVPHDLF
jgi:hypothetical protein